MAIVIATIAGQLAPDAHLVVWWPAQPLQV